MTTEESVVCDCHGPYPMGYSRNEWGLWVHYHCGRPTREYLDAYYLRVEAEALEGGTNELPD